MKEMNILVATNDGFVFPTSVLLKSLKDNHTRDYRFEVYVLCCSLTPESVENMNRLNDCRMSIHFLRVDDTLFEDVPLYSYFSKEVYYRLSAQDLLPQELKRILWLDGDMVINGSLDEFYFQDFDGKLWAAHEDMINGRNRKIHEKLSIPEEYIYCSSGMMLYHLEKLRERVRVRDIFRFISDHKDILQIVDQDALNALFYNEIKVWTKPYTYNYFAGHITRRNRQEVMKECSVIHYCGPYKPWKKKYPYYGYDLFWKYAIAVEGGKEIYEKVNKSCRLSHLKWVLYEEMKVFARHFMPMEKWNKLLGRKQEP